MRTPKFNRCDYCGRNAHKVAVRFPRGEVCGYCPTCWGDDAAFGAPDQARRRAEREGGEVVVVYDRRKARAS